MNLELILALMLGLLVTFLLIGVYKAGFERKVTAQEHIREALGVEAPTLGGTVLAKKDPNDLFKRRKKKKGEEQTWIDRLEIDLERANLAISTTEFILLSMGSGLLVFFLALFGFQQHPALSLLMGIGGVFGPKLFLLIKIMMRMKKAAAEFADVLDSMVNGFKTGYGFSRAVQMVSDNFHDPWGTEFGKLSAEMNLGMTQEEALFNLSNRVPSPDVDLFVTAILIQKETGGNMSELLATLSKTCRDRYKLFQRINAISAQGKLSAGIVCCIPFILAGLMFLFLPEAMGKFVSNPIGIILMILAGIWMCVGIGVLYKIVQIEV